MALSSSQYKFSIQGILIGKTFNSFMGNLPQAENITVQSVFHNVINLKSTAGLLSIVTSKVGKHSAYIVVDELVNEDFLSIDIRNGSAAIFSDHIVNIDNKLKIGLNSTYLWEGIFEKGFRWRLKALKRENLLYLEAALNIYSKKNSGFDKIFINKDKYLSEAVKGLKLNNGENSFPAFKYLIGYGPGLTPTGDDLLTGFMSVLTSCGDRIYSNSALRESLQANLKRTNYISCSMLLNAANNIYHERVQNLIYAFFCESPEDIFMYTRKLIDIGGTSGSDLATGIYLGFLYVFELIGRQGENIAY